MSGFGAPCIAVYVVRAIASSRSRFCGPWRLLVNIRTPHPTIGTAYNMLYQSIVLHCIGYSCSSSMRRQRWGRTNRQRKMRWTTVSSGL